MFSILPCLSGEGVKESHPLILDLTTIDNITNELNVAGIVEKCQLKKIQVLFLFFLYVKPMESWCLL